MATAQVSRPARRDDAGVSLMEAVVSAVILGVAAAVAATMVFGTLRVSTDTGRGTTAAELAASQIESIRQLAATDIPNGTTVLATQTVGGTAHTVTQEATSITYAGSVSACTGTGKLAAERVSVTVTWTGMGSTRPVATETIRSLGFDASSGGLDSTTGSATVYVLDASGNPVSAAQVLLQTSTGTALGSQTTGTDGCAVFTNLTASTNVFAHASKAGLVDLNGYDTASDTGSGVIANSVVKSTLQLDTPGSLAATMSLPSGTVMPASYGANAFKPYVTTSLWPSITSRRSPPSCATASPPQACVSASTSTVTTIGRLMPAAYGAWFGACLDARPPTLPLVSVVKAATAATTAVLAGVRVGPYHATAVGTTVTATHLADTSCTSGETITLGAMPAMGSTISVALPPGAWTVSVPSGTRSQTSTLVSGSVTVLSVA